MRNIFKNRLFKFGAPFMVLVLGGSFAIREFAQLRYQFRTVSQVQRAAIEKQVQMKKPEEVTLEKEYEKIKNLDIDDWKQVRGPRPWEEKIDN